MLLCRALMDQSPKPLVSAAGDQRISSQLQRGQLLERHRARPRAHKPPTSSRNEPKLSSLWNPKAFAAWRRYWRRQVATLEDTPEAHQVAAEWACSHTAGEVARFLGEQQFAGFEHVTTAIRQEARARFGSAITPELALLNIKISMSETPRSLAARAEDFADLYGIEESVTLQAVRNATAHITLVVVVGFAADSIKGWLKQLTEAASIADKPFRLITSGVQPDGAVRATDTGFEYTASRTAGAVPGGFRRGCHAAKPGQRFCGAS